MAVFTQYQAGLGSVGSYQSSGKPFVTGSQNPPSDGSDALKIEFPAVTRWIIVNNLDETDDHDVKCAFSQNGFDTYNYFTVGRDAGDYTNPATQRLELKVTELYLSGTSENVEVIAGLTGIATAHIQNNWSGSVGVG